MKITANKNTLSTTGGEKIPITTFSPAEQIATDHPLTMVIGNGAFSTPATLKPVIKHLIGTAANNGYHIDAIIHNDPYLGEGAYADSYRTERLADVVGAITEQKGAVHLLGHSWSWSNAVEVTTDQPGSIATLTGYTPVGHQALPVRETAWPYILEKVGCEILLPHKLISGLGSIAVGLSLAREIIRHLPESTTRKDILRTLSQDTTPAVLDLRREQPRLPIGIAAATHDKFFPLSSETKTSLSNAGVVIHELPTTHAGGVTDYRNGAGLFRLVRHLATMSQSPFNEK